jgi:hypothetical protein
MLCYVMSCHVRIVLGCVKVYVLVYVKYFLYTGVEFVDACSSSKKKKLTIIPAYHMVIVRED